MNSTRTWTLGAILAIVAILGGTVALGMQPQLSAAAAADTSTAQVHTANVATRVELGRLTRVAATQSTLDETDATLTAAVPSTLKLNTFSRAIKNIAVLDQVTIQSLALDPGVAYAVSGSGAPVVPVAADPEAKSGSTTESAAPAPAPVETKSPWFGKSDPLITGDNLTVVPVTVVVIGSDSAVLAFASDVQKAPRLFAVSSVNTTSDNGTSTATISGTIYSLKR